MEALPVPSPGTGLMFLSLGVAAGVAAMLYIRTIIGALSLMDRLYWPAVWRVPVIGAPIGPWGGSRRARSAVAMCSLSWPFPSGITLPSLFWTFPLCILLGPLSYTAEALGGLFAPTLILGAQFGLLFATLCGLL